MYEQALLRNSFNLPLLCKCGPEFKIHENSAPPVLKLKYSMCIFSKETVIGQKDKKKSESPIKMENLSERAKPNLCKKG